MRKGGPFYANALQSNVPKISELETCFHQIPQDTTSNLKLILQDMIDFFTSPSHGWKEWWTQPDKPLFYLCSIIICSELLTTQSLRQCIIISLSINLYLPPFPSSFSRGSSNFLFPTNSWATSYGQNLNFVILLT